MCFDGVAVLTTCVIHHEAYEDFRILFLNEIKQTYSGEWVNIFGSSDACELLIVAVDCTEDIVSLSSG
jgi:hypothetical protein